MNEARFPPYADFHTHSTASDGTLAPVELIHESARRGLRVVALTDHDTIQGVEEATTAGHEHGVTVVTGIEFSAHVERGELHLLGYGVDPSDQSLGQRLAELRNSRRERAARIADRLADLDIELPEDLVTGMASSESVGRPHIARALVEMGIVASVSEGFDKYLGRGRPAFVWRELIEPEEAIKLVQGAGGVTVIAHPLSVPHYRQLIPELISAGLAGIECYYGGYDEEQRAHLAEFAAELGVLATGGSDYHGPETRESRELGSVDIPEHAIVALLKVLEVS